MSSAVGTASSRFRQSPVDDISADQFRAEMDERSGLDVIFGGSGREASPDGRLETSVFPAVMAHSVRLTHRGGVYRRSIVNILRALAARSRNAALMFGTCSNLSRLIAKLRRHASVRGVLPVRVRQRSSS